MQMADTYSSVALNALAECKSISMQACCLPACLPACLPVYLPRMPACWCLRLKQHSVHCRPRLVQPTDQMQKAKIVKEGYETTVLPVPLNAIEHIINRLAPDGEPEEGKTSLNWSVQPPSHMLASIQPDH